jgi:hypothetical protein
MENLFSKIEQTGSSGNVFWKSRELSSTMGYSEYSKFKRIIDLAKQICKENVHEIADNFIPVGEMVKPAINYHLQKIFDFGALNKYSVIRKILITANNEKQDM